MDLGVTCLIVCKLWEMGCRKGLKKDTLREGLQHWDLE